MIELRGTTWDHERGWGGVRAAAEAYTRVRPDVRVTWETRSLQAFANEPVDALARRFDLIVLDHPAIGAAVAADALAPLDEHLDRPFLADHAASSVGRSAQSYVRDGSRWALAIDAAAQVAAYRPDLLDRAGLEVPRTWDEVVLACERLRARRTARPSEPWVAMPAIPVDAVCAFLAVCCALGEEPLAGPERVVSRPVGREALALLRRVVGASHPESLASNPPRTLERMASTDEIAYCPLAFGYVSYARAGAGRHPLRFTGGPAGADRVPRGTLGGAGLAVSARAAHVEEACAYAAFVAAAETQRTTYVEGGGQPGHRAAWADPRVNAEANGFFADTLEALDAAYLRPTHDGFVAFQDAAGSLVHGWLRDGGDADAVLDALDAGHRSLFERAGAPR